jgi:O-antigen ligase
MRRSTLMFALVSLILTYLVLLGTTQFSLLFLVELQPFTLGLLTSIVIAWFVHRWRRGWVWHRTAFDFVFLLWIAAFILSIFFNQATWRRSVESLWYMLLYIALWYMLMDLLANKVLSRQLMINASLFTGFMVIIFASWQVINALRNNLGIPRPESLFFNTNVFALFLVLLIPFSLRQVLNLRGIPRWINGLILLLAIPLLVLSESRGAWIASVVMIGVWLSLTMAERGLLSFAGFKAWWQGRNGQIRILLIIVLIVFIVAIIAMGLSILDSLNEGGRSLSLRTYLWNSALTMFQEKPLFGQGLFTYGYHLPRFESTPPARPQAHAHNIVLNVGAEMGIVGLIALFATGIVAIRYMWRNWHKASPQKKSLLTAAIAALAGAGVHHLVDVPIMMPAAAIFVLWVLIIAVAPSKPQVITASWQKIGQPITLLGIWALLLALGFWNSNLYGQYVALLKPVDFETYAATDYREKAEALYPIIAADPNQPAYIHMQAYLYGLAAAEGDIEAAELAIVAYERYVELEPYHAQGWSNLAGLYWQLGNQDDALNAIEQAIFYAPDWDFYRRQQDVYTGVQLLPDIEPVETANSRAGSSWAHFQFLRLVFTKEYLPQTGWGNEGR